MSSPRDFIHPPLRLDEAERLADVCRMSGDRRVRMTGAKLRKEVAQRRTLNRLAEERLRISEGVTT